jgi:tRNA(Arg) A34 adenosine deaminase TadA
MTNETHRHLLAAIELARRSRENGNHPFGALLVDADGNVVLEAENTVRTERDVTGHAETNLMRTASARFDPDFLERCTLYTSAEPCAMCAGAIYWGNVRRVVFGLSQEEIRRISGGNPEHMQLEITSREIFARGNHRVHVSGPHLREEARTVHEGFWD